MMADSAAQRWLILPRFGRRVVLCLFVALTACNTPPLYEQRARAFLADQGTPAETIHKLVRRKPLTPGEAVRLAAYDNVAVLHLLAANPGTPVALIERLAGHENFEVRTGVAVNPRTPVDTLLGLRTPGRYTTVNTMLARNPRLDAALLWEMFDNGEASLVDLGLNPNCPPELMRIIADRGTELDRTWLATNPNLPADVMARLARDESRLVRDYLATNPNYDKTPDQGGAGAAR